LPGLSAKNLFDNPSHSATLAPPAFLIKLRLETWVIDG